MFIYYGRRNLPTLLCLLMVIGLVGESAFAADSAIPWKAGDHFSRTSVNDDIRSVLRTLLGAEGFSVIFGPGVSGKISFAFKDTAVESAFDQILQQYALTAQYNPGTKTVIIDVAASASKVSVARHFVPLGRSDYDALLQALTSLAVGTAGITYDPETETVAIAGDELRIAQIEDLIKTVRGRARGSGRSGEPGNLQTKVIRLRFADVGPSARSFHGRTVTVPGILETLQTMLGSTADLVSTAADSLQANARNVPAEGVAQQPTTLAQILQNAVPPPVQSALSSIQEGPTPATARRPLPPHATISIDQRTNSVIVRGTPEQISAVESVVAQLDQPVQMVEIEVIIATAQIGVTQELGVNWRGLTPLSGSKGVGFDSGTNGGQVTSASGFDALSLLPTPNNAGEATATFITRLGSGFLQAQLQALAQKNKARILSAPRLVTLDNITARITRAADLYVPVSNGALSASGLSQIQTGLTLEITPSIVPAAPKSQDRLLRLSLNATDSSPSTSASGQITVSSHEVQTDVLVPDGGTLVLGGLFDDTHNVGQSGIPVLKDIPLLGHLFRVDSASESLGETVFFITPTIVDDDRIANRDVALGAGAVVAIAQKRKALHDAGNELDSLQGHRATNTVDLEEDQ